MKFISKKVIKGKSYYYLQYQQYSKYFGPEFPSALDVLDFFKNVAVQEYKLLPSSVKKNFKYGNLKLLEESHHDYICHENEFFANVQAAFMAKFVSLFTYHSNRQEGSRTTKGQIEKFVASHIRKPKTPTEHELVNSFEAFQYAILNDMIWNLKHIKKVHRLLLRNLDPLIAGKWKKEDNAAPENQLTVSHKEVESKMKDLLEWLHLRFKKRDMYPPELAINFYCRFEAIHPFQDGNGRVGRILLNAILKRFKYPYVIFFSENAIEHNAAITAALAGRWVKFYKHFLKQIKKTDDTLKPKTHIGKTP